MDFVKKFENPLRIDEVIAMNLVHYFFGRHCVYAMCIVRHYSSADVQY